MERKSSTSRPICPFVISVDELEQLIGEIEADGPNRQLKLDKIVVKTKNSTLYYDNLGELRHDRTWQKGIEKFSVMFKESKDDARPESRTIHIDGGDDWNNEVWVSGDEEAWVVGTADIMREKMKKYRVWYSKIVKGEARKFFCYVLIIMALTSMISLFISQAGFLGSSTKGIFNPYATYAGAFISIPISLWLVNKIPTRSRLIRSHNEAKSDRGWMMITAVATIIGVIVAIWSVLSG